MASIYTDAEREHRYAKLRKKKKIYDTTLGICMFAALFFAAVGVIPNLISAILEGLFAFDISHFLATLGEALCYAAVIYAIYAKKWKISLVILIVTLFFSPTIGPMICLIMLVTTVTDWFWGKLEEEEGFPLFDISFKEQEERRRKMEQITQNRALQAGTRAEHTGNPDNMSDILDPDGNTPVSRANVSGYAQRTELSAPGTEAMPQYAQGIMDDLADIAVQERSASRVQLEKNPIPAYPASDASRVCLHKEPASGYQNTPDGSGQNNQPV